MIWLRTGFVRMLVAIFLVAQVAGAISLPLGKAEAIPSTLAQHVSSAAIGTARHHHGCLKVPFTDRCCTLLGVFVGIVCPTVTIERPFVTIARLAPAADVSRRTHITSRLDRPPKNSGLT